MLRSHVSLGLILFALLTASGCDFFGGTAPPKEEEKTVEEQYIERVRGFEAGGYVVEDILVWAERVQKANVYVKIENRATWPNFWPVADAMFAKALEVRSTPEEQLTLYRALFLIQAEARDDGSETIRKALAVKPDLVLWNDVGATMENQNAVTREVWLEMCNALRPLVDADPQFDEEDFFSHCFRMAEEDPSRLWPGAKEEYANREKLKERLAKFNPILATLFPGGGSCNPQPGYCHTHGWIDWEEQVQITCTNDDCTFVGWEANTPDGIVNIRCNKDDCTEYGWKTKGGSQSWTATCGKGGCSKGGWTLKGKKDRYKVTCRGEDCFSDGYDVVTSKGWKFACYCENGNCETQGTFCKAVP
jgi:hypothetical protein